MDEYNTQESKFLKVTNSPVESKHILTLITLKWLGEGSI